MTLPVLSSQKEPLTVNVQKSQNNHAEEKKTEGKSTTKKKRLDHGSIDNGFTNIHEQQRASIQDENGQPIEEEDPDSLSPKRSDHIKKNGKSPQGGIDQINESTAHGTLLYNPPGKRKHFLLKQDNRW
jgi:hypothetical protein